MRSAPQPVPLATAETLNFELAFKSKQDQDRTLGEFLSGILLQTLSN